MTPDLSYHWEGGARLVQGYNNWDGKKKKNPQPSDFVPLKNGFHSSRAQID